MTEPRFGYLLVETEDGSVSTLVRRLVVPNNSLRVSMADAADIAPPPFIAPTLLNSWVDYGLGYQGASYVLHGGIVYVRGLVKNGTVGVGTPIFTLPVGYRPPADLIFATVANDLFGRLGVKSNGEVSLVVGSNVFASLNCCFLPT